MLTSSNQNIFLHHSSCFPFLESCQFKNTFSSKVLKKKMEIKLDKKRPTKYRGLADVCDMIVFTQQKLISGKSKRLLSFAFRNFYFIYMFDFKCFMLIEFSVFYNFLHFYDYLCRRTGSVMSNCPHFSFCIERAKAM